MFKKKKKIILRRRAFFVAFGTWLSTPNGMALRQSRYLGTDNAGLHVREPSWTAAAACTAVNLGAILAVIDIATAGYCTFVCSCSSLRHKCLYIYKFIYIYTFIYIYIIYKCIYIHYTYNIIQVQWYETSLQSGDVYEKLKNIYIYIISVVFTGVVWRV